MDATIELERRANVRSSRAPLSARHSTISLFKVVPPRDAVRTPVKIGRRSVQFVEVVDGLVKAIEWCCRTFATRRVRSAAIAVMTPGSRHD